MNEKLEHFKPAPAVLLVTTPPPAPLCQNLSWLCTVNTISGENLGKGVDQVSTTICTMN